MIKKNLPKTKLTQILPSARVIPRIELPRKLEEDLTDIADAAYRSHYKSGGDGQTALAVIMAPVRVQSAVAWFVSSKYSEKSIPEFRDDVDIRKPRSIAAAVKTLLDRLPGDSVPPLAQMRSLYCYDDAQSNGLRSADTPNEIDDKRRREDRWDAQFSARAVRGALEQWLELLARLKEESGSGRTPVTAQSSFVRALAGYWSDELKLPFKMNTAGKKFDQRQNLFAQFALKAAEGIPDPYNKHLNWVHAVRENTPKKS